jgi:ubiquinone/menaquinone biosynthesis C-methylase UbiE
MTTRVLEMKPNDRWHKGMYDHWFASTTIGSSKFRKLAKKEASFLVSTLGLKRGQHILDVPCGTGRHSAIFARHGLAVTGIDINEPCLKLARKACRGKSVTLRNGDMSKLSRYCGQFDAVANLFTSFGYFQTDQKNEQVLRELISTLKPGGQMVAQEIVCPSGCVNESASPSWTRSDSGFVHDLPDART